jgi:hydroxymethylpyrimidine kinase / phosphomethylpyrimidine kinase / thiamine-phosphate diphosphorylase
MPSQLSKPKSTVHATAKIKDTSTPIVWTIAGSDSGGGAGIQADLKTINQLGAHGASVVTALTAQNTRSVRMIEAASPKIIAAQLDALGEDLPPRAIKLGMLYSADAVRAIAGRLENQNAFVVCDPVMVATSGDALALPEMKKALIKEIIPRCNLLTPNLEEAHALLKIDPPKELSSSHDLDIEKLAEQLLQLGCQSVLIKGGSLRSEFCQDFWTNGRAKAWLTSPCLPTRNTHGTGCTLSAAIATAFALGYEELDAIVIAKAYVNQGLRLSPDLGHGQGPMSHSGWPEREQDIPWLTSAASEGRLKPSFPDCGSERLGFYPIVDSFDLLEKLLPLGVKTAQLRVKKLNGPELEKEIRRSVELANKYQCRLFINDYWELACKMNAYGVHLGQDDLIRADIDQIRNAGLRLGLSTHCYREVARALAVRPSYIAIGPIHETTTKEMKFNPQGIEGFRRWRRSLNYPLVAIGGLFLDNAQEVIDAGADGIAVVRDVIQAGDLAQRVHDWLAVMPYKMTGGG